MRWLLIILILFSACKASQPELTLVDTIPYNDYHRLDSVALVANRVLKPIPGKQTFAVYEEVQKPAKKSAKSEAVEVVSSEGTTILNIGKKGTANINWHSPNAVATEKNKPINKTSTSNNRGFIWVGGFVVLAGLIYLLVSRYFPKLK